MEHDTPSRRLSRRNFIQMSAVGAASMMLLGSTGCAAGPAESKAASASYTPGTYTATAEGKNGPLSLEVVFSESAIDSIAVTTQQETRFISDVALEQLPLAIVEYQSLGIDAITGATFSSMAVLAAVGDCVVQAGGRKSDLEKVPAREKVTETVELDADVVVVGAGASGMGAAIAAAQSGARNVVVIEKTSNMGGNALVSGGWILDVQAPDALRTDMNEGYATYFKSVIDKGYAQGAEKGIDSAFVDGIQEAYDAYYAQGGTKVFDSTDYMALEYQFSNGGNFEKWKNYSKLMPVVTTWLSDMDFDWAPLHSIIGFPWPRWTGSAHGHLGEGYYDAFVDIMDRESLPITLITLTAAKELLVEGGRVSGVIGECDDGTTYRVKATDAVILATGGYSGNPEMLKKYNTFWDWDDSTKIRTTNAYGHTGDGIEMATAAGAAIDYMGNPMMLPFADVKDFTTDTFVGNPTDFMLVNAEGARFVNESLDRYTISGAIMKQTDETGFVISDSTNCGIKEGVTGTGSSEEMLIEKGQLLKADTIEELASLIGADPATFKNTVDSHNAYAAAKEDKDFGRSIYTPLAPIGVAPFYASPRTWAAHITLGGIVVDDSNYQALDEKGMPIEGLYCVGELVAERSGVHSMSTGVYAAQQLFA